MTTTRNVTRGWLLRPVNLTLLLRIVKYFWGFFQAELRQKREKEKLEKKAGAGARDGEKVGIQNRTNNLGGVINDNAGSVLSNQSNNRLDKGDFKATKTKKDPSPMGTSFQGLLQDKSLKGPQQQQFNNKSKSETAQTVEQINKQQQSLPGQQQQNRTSNFTGNKSLLQQQQQTNKQVPGDKRQLLSSSLSSAKDRPVTANRKLPNKHVGRDLSKHIPRFYFPMGQPPQSDAENEAILQRIKEAFAAVEGGKASRVQMASVAKVNKFTHLTTV